VADMPSSGATFSNLLYLRAEILHRPRSEVSCVADVPCSGANCFKSLYL